MIEKVLEFFNTRWSIVKELLKYHLFLYEFRKESQRIEDIIEFVPNLDKFFSTSIKVKYIEYFSIRWTLDSNYNNLYNKIRGLRNYITNLFAWKNVYEKVSGEKRKLSLLYSEIKDNLILACDAIYSFKESIIYATVTTAFQYKEILNQPTGWTYAESKISLNILKKYFMNIKEVRDMVVEIEKIHKCLINPPLNFRHKHTHRIAPGIEKYGGQNYTISKSPKSLRIGFGTGEKIKIEEIKVKLEEIYCDCISLFYKFENYCVNYLKLKEW